MALIYQVVKAAFSQLDGIADDSHMNVKLKVDCLLMLGNMFCDDCNRISTEDRKKSVNE